MVSITPTGRALLLGRPEAAGVAMHGRQRGILPSQGGARGRRAAVQRLAPAGGCLALLALLAYYVYRSASTGVGGESFAGILVQCVYKSYASVDKHQKTGEVYTSATDVLTRHGQRAGQSALSVDFGTDKMDRHNYTDYYDILLAPYLKQTVNVMVWLRGWLASSGVSLC